MTVCVSQSLWVWQLLNLILIVIVILIVILYLQIIILNYHIIIYIDRIETFKISQTNYLQNYFHIISMPFTFLMTVKTWPVIQQWSGYTLQLRIGWKRWVNIYAWRHNGNGTSLFQLKIGNTNSFMIWISVILLCVTKEIIKRN